MGYVITVSVFTFICAALATPVPIALGPAIPGETPLVIAGLTPLFPAMVLLPSVDVVAERVPDATADTAGLGLATPTLPPGALMPALTRAGFVVDVEAALLVDPVLLVVLLVLCPRSEVPALRVVDDVFLVVEGTNPPDVFLVVVVEADNEDDGTRLAEGMAGEEGSLRLFTLIEEEAMVSGIPGYGLETFGDANLGRRDTGGVCDLISCYFGSQVSSVLPITHCVPHVFRHGADPVVQSRATLTMFATLDTPP